MIACSAYSEVDPGLNSDLVNILSGYPVGFNLSSGCGVSKDHDCLKYIFPVGT